MQFWLLISHEIITFLYKYGNRKQDTVLEEVVSWQLIGIRLRAVIIP